MFSVTNSSRATAHHGIVRPTVDSRLAGISLHDDLSRCGTGIAVRVHHAKEDRVDATVTSAVSLSTQLHGFAVGGDDYVIQRVAVAAAAVLKFVAGYLSDHDAANRDTATAVVVYTGHKVRHLEGLVLVIGRPH